MLDYPHLRRALLMAARTKGLAIPVGFSPTSDEVPGVPCRELIAAVQEAYGLHVSGLFDAPTRAFLIPPTRCPKPPLLQLPGLVVAHGIRPLSAIRHTVLHTTEGGGTLQSLGAFFHNEQPEKDGVTFAVDAGGRIAQYVPLTAEVYHVKSHNYECVGIEQIAMHTFTRDEWLTHRLDQIHATAWLVSWLHNESGRPIRRSASLRHWIAPSGVCQHADVPDNDHIDCGGGYPFDLVLQLASAWQHSGPPPAVTGQLRSLAAQAAA